MEKKEIYEVTFNDFGLTYAVATSFTEAEKLFWNKHGNNYPNYTLKSIKMLQTTSEILL